MSGNGNCGASYNSQKYVTFKEFYEIMSEKMIEERKNWNDKIIFESS